MLPEKFSSHPVHEKLKQLKEIIDAPENKEKIDLDNLTFFEEFIRYSKSILNTTIPVLIQEPDLNSLSTEIERGTSELNNFIGNNNVGHINNAINNLNSALNRLRNIPIPFSSGDFNFSDTISDFQKNLKEKYKDIQKDQEQLQSKLNDSNSVIQQNNTELQKFKKELSDKGKEIDNLNLNFQNEFNNIKNQENQAFASDRNNFKKLFEEDKKNYKSQMEAQEQNIKEKGEKIIEELNSKLDEAKRIVNVVGDVGITGKYQEIAKRQGKAANVWRVIAFMSMLIMCVLLIYTIWDISKASYDVTKSVIRIIAALALSYPATYASKESSKFRQLEIKNRSLELELTSLNPFIELLPEAKKQEIKEKLVEKYFGNSNHNEIDVKEGSKEELSISAFERIFKIISGFIRK